MDPQPPPSPPTGLAAGHVIGGRYRLVQRIAGGGMASVWEAVDDVLARPVAVKLLHPHLAADEHFVTRFRREAVAAARLAHPNIVSIFDTCSDGGTEAIVMELVRGTTLRAELDRQGRLVPAAAASVVAEIADALVAAHAAGIVHRDVKPANVLLSTDGRVLVADFGIAKAIDELELTGAGTTLGTAKYLAPEQVEGKPVDGRTDVYAAGVILYELLAGTPPFAADTEAATALARLHRDPDPLRAANPGVPPDLEAIALRALARDPAQRLASASALRDALRAFGRGSPAPLPSTAVGATGLTDATYVVDATRASLPAPPKAPPPSHRPAFPAPAPAAPAHSPAQPSPKRRRWGVAITLGLVLGAAAVAIVLAIQAGGGGGGDDGDPIGGFSRDDGAPAEVSLAAFDPQGDGAENDDLVGSATDGDLGTSWRSECYRSAAFGNLKEGVGLVVDLGATQDVSSVDVVAAPSGWSAQVFVADEAAADVAGWGEPVGTVDGGGSDESIDVDGTGRFVLVFFTGLSDEANGECQAANPNAVSVAELRIE